MEEEWNLGGGEHEKGAWEHGERDIPQQIYNTNGRK